MDERVEFNKDEISAIQKDIESARASLVSEETKKQIEAAKVEARKSAEQEFLVNQKIKEQEALIEQLRQEKINKETEFNDKFQTMEAKMNDLISSKAPVTVENPFKSEPPQATTVETMTDAQINAFEQESGRAFLGNDYDPSRV